MDALEGLVIHGLGFRLFYVFVCVLVVVVCYYLIFFRKR